MASLADISSSAFARATISGQANRPESPSISSDSSYISSDEDNSSATACRWQTRQFHDQECSRYFDCPTHTVERRLSIDQGPQRLRQPDDDLQMSSSEDAGTGRDRVANTESGLSSGLGQEPQSHSRQPQEDTTDLYEPHEIGSLTHLGGPFAMSGTNSGERRRSEPGREWARSSARDEREAAPSPSPTGLPSLSSGLPSPRSIRHSMSHEHRGAMMAPGARRTSQTQRSEHGDRGSAEFGVPRWQPDAEVTLCPICHTQFSIFIRKHHCRKCGRVVCNSCSPHRIIVPHQYIVRPPGMELPLPQSLLMDSLGVGYFGVNGLSGGERVRLCNPCVPDPNVAPPQSPTPSASISPRPVHHRSRSSIGNAYGPAPTANRYGVAFTTGQPQDLFRSHAHRARSITMSPAAQAAGGSSGGRYRSSTMLQHPSMSRSGPSASHVSSYPNRYTSLGPGAASSSRHRRLPPTPQVAEEDECPICHRELPSRNLPDFEALRETHITSCITSHSTYGTPRNTGTPDIADEAVATPPPPPRRTGMYSYPATEKDCIDDAECTICLEEFTVGVSMARLECLCRFHRSCIAAWFVDHPGRCPVHQHDGFGY